MYKMMFNNSSELNSTLPSERLRISFPKLPHDEIEIIASTIIYVALGLMIIVGNGLVIAAYRSNIRLQTVTNTFLVGLAVSDILVGLISVPLWIYFSVCQQYQTCSSNQGLLVFYSTADIFVSCASLLQLTAISIERFIAITRPISHRTYSIAYYNRMIVAAWVYAFLIAGLFPIQITRWEKVYTVILVTTCFALPTAAIFVVYVFIFRTAKVSSNDRVHPEGFPKRALQQETKIAVTIAVITGLFVLAWTPFFVVNVVATFCLHCLPPYPGVLRLLRFIKWMHYSNSIANPCVYAYRNIQMRRTFLRLLRSLFCCCKPEEYHIDRSSKGPPGRTPQAYHGNEQAANSLAHVKSQRNEGFSIEDRPSRVEYHVQNTISKVFSSPAEREHIEKDHETFPDISPEGKKVHDGQNSGDAQEDHSDDVEPDRGDQNSDQGTRSKHCPVVVAFNGVRSICEDNEATTEDLQHHHKGPKRKSHSENHVTWADESTGNIRLN